MVLHQIQRCCLSLKPAFEIQLLYLLKLASSATKSNRKEYAYEDYTASIIQTGKVFCPKNQSWESWCFSFDITLIWKKIYNYLRHWENFIISSYDILEIMNIFYVKTFQKKNKHTFVLNILLVHSVKIEHTYVHTRAVRGLIGWLCFMTCQLA